MRLPFTHEQFLEVFARYNEALWPVAALFWLATVAAVWLLCGRRDRAGTWLLLLLAVQRAWAGAVYHLGFFRVINPVAAVFGALFLFQGALLVWSWRARRVALQPSRSAWGWIGLSLIGFGLFYPFAGALSGLAYPRLPTFGVPCPTAILTAGALLLAPPGTARLLSVIPILWAAIAGSSALALGVLPDLMLLLAGILLLIHCLAPAVAAENPRRA